MSSTSNSFQKCIKFTTKNGLVMFNIGDSMEHVFITCEDQSRACIQFRKTLVKSTSRDREYGYSSYIRISCDASSAWKDLYNNYTRLMESAIEHSLKKDLYKDIEFEFLLSVFSSNENTISSMLSYCYIGLSYLLILSGVELIELSLPRYGFLSPDGQWACGYSSDLPSKISFVGISSKNVLIESLMGPIAEDVIFHKDDDSDLKEYEIMIQKLLENASKI